MITCPSPRRPPPRPPHCQPWRPRTPRCMQCGRHPSCRQPPGVLQGSRPCWPPHTRKLQCMRWGRGVRRAREVQGHGVRWLQQLCLGAGAGACTQCHPWGRGHRPATATTTQGWGQGRRGLGRGGVGQATQQQKHARVKHGLHSQQRSQASWDRSDEHAQGTVTRHSTSLHRSSPKVAFTATPKHSAQRAVRTEIKGVPKLPWPWGASLL